MENRPEKFWGLFPAEVLGKELELQESERSWWLAGYSDVCAIHVNTYRVSEVSSVPRLTAQPCEPPSLPLSWPAAKPAIPMLASLAGNTKHLITV